MATLTETGQRRFVTHVPSSITLGNSTEREKKSQRKFPESALLSQRLKQRDTVL